MPFDGNAERSTPVRSLNAPLGEPPVEARIIDEMLDILGPHGENWIQQAERLGQKFCIVGALKHAEHLLRVDTCNRAHTLISEAIGRCHNTDDCIVTFNDRPELQFSDIREALLIAKCEALRLRIRTIMLADGAR
jgi:hypothetical protein